MATPLEDAEVLLVSIDKGIKELKNKYESKQSERVLSNHVWMIDYIENNVKKYVAPLIESLNKLKTYNVGDFQSTTNFDITIKYSTEIDKILNEILFLYKARENYIDVKLKWQYNLPKLMENIQHLKNRFAIIKGQITRKRFEYEEESWF